MRQSKVISICGAFLILSSAVFAGPPMTIMVPIDFPTIQGAIDFANDGDTVVVSPGTYNENIDFKGKNITVTSTNPEDPATVAMTVIDGSQPVNPDNGSVVIFASGEGRDAILQGFTLTGGTGTLIGPNQGGGGIFCSNASPSILHNVIINNTAPKYGGGLWGSAGSNPLLYGNKITNNSANSWGGAVYTYEPIEIRNNIVCDNSASGDGGGLYVRDQAVIVNNMVYSNTTISGDGGGIYLRGANNSTVTGNTIVGNTSAKDGANLDIQFSDNVTVSNNIIAEALVRPGVYIYNSSALLFKYNNVWNNAGGNYEGMSDPTGIDGNISEDPLFVDTNSNNYHLQLDSGCIDAGDPAFIAEPDEMDIDGDPRVLSGRIDIGADECSCGIPVANAGPDQFLIEIGEVTLDGSDSYDSDPCDVLTYQWTQIAGPAVELSDATAVQPTFMPDVEGEYRFELVVNDGVLTSYPDEVLIVVGNRRPVADAGPDRVCQVGDQVQLDGSGSYDPDPGELTYTWTQLAGPAVDLQDPCTATPYFDCTEEGVYEFELVVSDGVDDSEADTVPVLVTEIIIEQQILDVGHTHHEPGVEGAYHHYPDVSGCRIVYSEGEACDYSWFISSEDLEDNNADWLDYWWGWGGAVANAQPKIDGDIVVWFGPGRFFEEPWGHEPSNASITILNVATGQKKALRRYTMSESYSHPAVSGNKVVWLEHLDLDTTPIGSNEAVNWWNTPYNICGADITDFDEPVYFTIAENVGSRDPYPCHSYGEDFDDVIDICSDIAVWEAEGDIYGADISDLDNIEVFTICNDPGRQFDPAISGSVVVWTDERSDAGDIYGADISNVEEIEVFEIVKETGNQQQAEIDNNMIVYVDGGLYGGQIKVCYVIRQYGDALDIPLSGSPYGCGPAIDGNIIIWQSAPYGYAHGMSVEVSYSIFDGPVENMTSGKRHDYIQHAINFADYGDVIVAGSGVYHENINFKGKSVVLTSGGPDKSGEVADAVIQGDGTGSVVTFAGTEDPNCQLVGFTITGGKAVGGGGIFGGWATPTISRCVIRNNTSARHGGGISTAHGIIEGCTIFENTAGSGGGGMANCHGTISSCLIYNNTAGYIGAMSNCDGDIINCTVTNNTSSISPGGLAGCDGSIINCIIWGNYHDQLLNCSEPAYSCIQDWSGGGIGNIAGDPLFWDANSVVPLEGMDAYWMFDGDPNDSMPNGHDGILVGDAGFAQDPDRGQVLMLDGDGDCVEMTDYKGITGTNPRTVSAWIKTDMNTVGTIISWGSSGAGGNWLVMLFSSGQLGLGVSKGNINGTTVINDGQWHHVTVVWEEDFGRYVRDVKLYIDGVAEGTSGSLRKIDTGSEADVTIGCLPGGGWYFDGLLDEVAVWDKALSGAEISILYERGLRGDGYLRVEGDFHLLAGSPCIDAADNLAVATNADVDGNARILDGNNDGESVVDMGACEFVYPNIRPVADAMDDQTVFAWIDGIAEVGLDGSGSFDADGDELEYFWFIGDEQIATGIDPNVELAVGEHTIELIVNDGTEDSEPNEVVITVIGPIEADVHIVPRVINRNNRLKRIIAIMRLPAGIGKGDVVRESFELYAGGLDAEPIGAIWQRVIGRGNMMRVFALFDKGELMDAVPNDGRVELTVVGRLESGQYIYGSNTVRIIQPRRQRGWWRRGR